MILYVRVYNNVRPPIENLVNKDDSIHEEGCCVTWEEKWRPWSEAKILGEKIQLTFAQRFIL